MQKRFNSLMRSSRVRWLLLGAVQIGTFVFSGLVAFLLRFDFRIPANFLSYLVIAVSVWVVAKSVTFHFADLDRRGYRYVSVLDAYRLLLANIAGSLISCLAILILAPSGFPRSVYLIDLLLCTTGRRDSG